MVGTVSRILQGLLYGSISLCRRAMCFLNRKRHNSDSHTLLPIHIAPKSTPETPVPCSDPHTDLQQLQTTVSSAFEEVPEHEAFAEWDDWSSKPADPLTTPCPQQSYPMNTHSGFAVSNQSKPLEPEPEPEPDYFTDLGLAPTIKAQTRVLVKDRSAKQESSSRISGRMSFAANEDIVPAMSNVLGEWDDAEPDGWDGEEDLTEVAELARRQAKLEDRQRRMLEHQKRKQKLDEKRGSKSDGLGVR